MFKILIILLILATLAVMFLVVLNKNNNPNSASPSLSPAVSDSIPAGSFSMPISNASSRVTKKPFGLYVSPKNSPINPEKFTGYHTGVDFETLPDEKNINIPFYAICDGSLTVKKTATGYGGVLVQSCSLNGQLITVIYGHIRLTSVNLKVGDKLKSGQQIGALGAGYGFETDGERKHLHLGIHKGSSVNILGYVQNRSELNDWIDLGEYIR